MKPTNVAVELVCVYRERNASFVSELVTETELAGGRAHLWALDRPAEELARVTVGSGPGSRLALLNSLTARTQADKTLIVADDDVTFSAGGLSELVETARRARLDLAQPAHDVASHATHRMTLAWPRTMARRTAFVEVGPLVMITPRLRPEITPFPERYGMGWGLDVVWSDLTREGWRLGVVDRVHITHHGPVGAAYDTADSEEVLSRELALRGLDGMNALNVTLSAWRTWGPLDPRSRWPLFVPTRQGLRTRTYRRDAGRWVAP